MNEKQVHNFINKHTALAVLILVVGCFLAGYFVGSHSKYDDKYDGYDKYNLMMRGGEFDNVRNY